MSSEQDTTNLTPLQRALFAVKDMRSRLETIERTRTEPIAVIGVGCRFPGGIIGPDSFWQLLKDGRDAITEVPPERWDLDQFYDPDPNAPGKMMTRWGGFIDNVDRFDAAFFGIAPREAAGMDPQQRSFLEIAWEALENAGIAPGSLNGSLTGVFAGISTSDYFQLQGGTADLDRIDPYTGTGGAFSVAAGRLSYVLGLNGPNLPVDTACSSSLVAVHLACQSLRQSECNLAIAGGVNLILSPAGTIYFSRLRAMARDGRCKTFDAAADGYVRSEGCGFVVLERLSDAQAHGREIHGVVLGSAVNHDGRSGGLTAPSRFAQQSVLRSALASAGVKPGEVGYVEAHGTGTPLGDPIELAALAGAMGEGRDADHRLLVGSVKTNIGHTEAAAGIAGLIKVLLSLKHAEIPAHLHFREPNPYVAWKEIPITIPSRPVSWPPVAGQRRVAGVSSFGFSGTNAHVILSEHPQAPESAEADQDRPFHILPLSARTPAALAELASRYERHLSDHANESLPNLCHTAGSGRSHFGHRAAIVVGDGDALHLREDLLACARGESSPRLYRNAKERSGAPRVGFVFEGDIASATGRSQALSHPVFGRAMEECTQLFRAAGTEPPPLFALQYGLAEMWRAWGVQPSLVIGQGLGEYAAACVAGIFTLQDAVSLIADPETKVAFQPGNVPLISASSGQILRLQPAEMTAYWQRHSGRPDQFDQAIQTASGLGCEIMIRLPEPGQGRGGLSVMESLARLYVEGMDIDWQAFDREYPRKTVALPTYPFQRQRYWLESAPAAATRVKTSEPAEKGEDDFLYEVKWQQSPAGTGRVALRGTWLLFSDEDAMEANAPEKTARSFAQALKGLGNDAICVARGEAYGKGEALWRIDAEYAGQFDRLLRDVHQDSGTPCAGVIFIWGSQTSTLSLCTALLHLVQALARAEGTGAPRLHVVTRGVHKITAEDSCSGLDQAALWGFGRAVGIEHASLWGGLIDIGDGDSNADELLSHILRADAHDNECAFRNGIRYVPRLARTASSKAPKYSLKEDASYLITGGLGALGLEVASWMVRSGARHLLLAGRHAASAEVDAILGKLRQAGAHVEAIRADVSNPVDARQLMDGVPGFPPVRGIVHAAGLLEDGVVLRQSPERLARVLAPKVAGAWNLHILSTEKELDFFVLFSSAASLFGSPGQSSYAAANAFMDALAWHRHARGLPAIALNWGPWDNAGMSSSRRALPGTSALSVQQGLRALEESIAGGSPQVAVLPFQWNLFVRQFPQGAVPAMLTDLAREETYEAEPGPKGAAFDPGILDEIRRSDAPTKTAILTKYLTVRLERIAGITIDEVSLTRDFLELGIDSLMAMELVQGIRQDLSLALYPREFYEHPSISAMAAYLATELDRLHGSKAASNEPVVEFVPAGSGPLRSAVADRLAGVALLLSSPRSGSTLLRVMLAGHPALFCPPELHLLPFESMAERSRKLGASYLDEGLQRAFMEAGKLDAAGSRAIVDDLVKRDVPVAVVYRMLKEMAGDRLLIDKSPTYASDAATLKHAEIIFEGARYIHLVRHPAAMIESFVRNRMDKLAGRSSGDPNELAARLWAAGNTNLLDFLKGIEPDRHMRIRFETLVREAEPEMKRLCAFLNVPFDTSVLQPYEGRRMTDGVHAKSLAIGDPDFLTHDRIEASKADAWREQALTPRMAGILQPAAGILGYETGEPMVAESRERYVESRARRIFVCEWGPQSGPAVVCLHGMLDHAASWRQVARNLAEDGCRVIAPDLRGHGLSDHEAPSSSYHLVDFVGDLSALVEELSLESFTLVGHSLGAGIAALYAAARPQNLSSLVLVEPPSAPREDRTLLDRFITQLDQLRSAAEHPVFPDLRTAASRIRVSMPSLSEIQAEEDARRLTRDCDGGLTWRWDPRLRTRAIAGVEALSGEFYIDVLRRVGNITTLIYGTGGITSGGRGDPPKIPGARCLMFSGGHNLHLDAPQLLAGAIREQHAYKVGRQ